MEYRMDVYSVKNKDEYAAMLTICKNLWEKRTLIPILGSGFTLNTPTDNGGNIPNVNDLKVKLFDYISRFSGYSKEELDEIGNEPLSSIAKTFDDIFNRIPENEIKQYYGYIEKNFCKVSFFKGFQRAFLNIDWPYLFTLNYDTLIENYDRKYYPIIPFNKINRYHESGKIKVYKLHGDAKRYLDTGENKYFILSEDQYVKALKDDSNIDMLNELLTAFSSKSIIFFGCGLSNELDLLFSSQFNIGEKVSRIDREKQSIIYLSFEDDERIKQSLSQRRIDILKRYGITRVFRFGNERETENFFNCLKEQIDTTPQDEIEEKLDRYSSAFYTSLKPLDKRNRDFLFNEGLVWSNYSKHSIILPAFFVERTVSNEIVNNVLSKNNAVCFISGNFYSGKTMALLQISRCFPDKKVYIFPTGTHLNEQEIRAILRKNNSLFCFDTRSITTAQIKMILEEKRLNEIKKLNSYIIITIDKSDAPMYKYFFEARNKSKNFDLFMLSNKFDKEEREKFNKKGGAVSLPLYKNEEPLLDYIVRNEQKLLDHSVENFLAPHKRLLAKDEKRRIMALVMLATEVKISAKRAIQFNIDRAIEDIIVCETGEENILNVIEKDYSIYNGDSSGFEYVCNSKYWVIRALSEYAKEHKNSRDSIANAYLDIIKTYRSIYSDDVAFYQNAEPYYFFDHIQTLFNPHWFVNSTGLMNQIYDILIPELSESYQFLHQKAKGKLIIAQVQLKKKNFKDAKVTLDDAAYNITRATELAEQYPNARNIDETLLHMAYTEGRIWIEQSCISDSYIRNAVNACYKLYQLQVQSSHDIYDYAVAVGNDMWAFKKFKYKLLSLSLDHIATVDIPDKEKVEYLLNRWTGKRIKVSL